MNLLVKFPTRSRPDKFLSVLAKYMDMSTSGKVKYLVSIDNDDTTMTSDVVYKARGMGATVVSGVSDSKIQACNRDMAHAGEWDIVVLASDDMVPVKHGWDSLIIAAFEIYFPDTDGVIHFSDGHTSLNTQCILGRKYYNRFGYIYHPSYVSLWCDNEFQQVSWMLDKCVFINETIIEHQHYSNGYGGKDRLMQETERYYQIDQRNFEKRKLINFELK